MRPTPARRCGAARLGRADSQRRFYRRSIDYLGIVTERRPARATAPDTECLHQSEQRAPYPSTTRNGTCSSNQRTMLRALRRPLLLPGCGARLIHVHGTAVFAGPALPRWQQHRRTARSPSAAIARSIFQRHISLLGCGSDRRQIPHLRRQRAAARGRRATTSFVGVGVPGDGAPSTCGLAAIGPDAKSRCIAVRRSSSRIAPWQTGQFIQLLWRNGVGSDRTGRPGPAKASQAVIA